MKIIQRTFIPGDRWIYFKIYTGVKTADWIIAVKLFPIIRNLIKDKFIEKFYFIRYNDPDFHLRIRFLLVKNLYSSHVINMIHKTLKPIVDKQLAWKLQLDTYQREIERYNLYLIENTESLFYIDSIYIIKIIRELVKIKNENYRWMISLLLIDNLLSDLDFTLNQKKELMISMSNSFKTEFGFNEFNSKQFNEKYRINKSIVESILNNTIIDNNYNKFIKLIWKRSNKMKPVIINIQQIIKLKKLNIENYIHSYIHMTMNRLFRTDNRLYELIIYDFMKRFYISQIAIRNQLKLKN